MYIHLRLVHSSLYGCGFISTPATYPIDHSPVTCASCDPSTQQTLLSATESCYIIIIIIIIISFLPSSSSSSSIIHSVRTSLVLELIPPSKHMATTMTMTTPTVSDNNSTDKDERKDAVHPLRACSRLLTWTPASASQRREKKRKTSPSQGDCSRARVTTMPKLKHANGN